VHLKTYKSNRHVVYSNKYHVVWCPKYRRKVLIDAVAKRLERILKTLCAEMRVDILALEIMPGAIESTSQVHAACRVKPLQ
jgi:putative transposase